MTFRQLEFSKISFGIEDHPPILEKVDFNFPLEHNVSLHGASGAGRSTLFKLLAALSSPVSGEYFINHEPLSQKTFSEFLPMRLKIGYAFDHNGLLNNRTLADNLILPLVYHKICSSFEAKKRVDVLLEAFQLTAFAKSLPSAISPGKRKACVLARTFIHEPELVFLDEPTVGLDPDQTRTLVNLIKSQRAQGTLLHVYFISRDQSFTHELSHLNLHLKAHAIELMSAQAGAA